MSLGSQLRGLRSSSATDGAGSARGGLDCAGRLDSVWERGQRGCVGDVVGSEGSVGERESTGERGPGEERPRDVSTELTLVRRLPDVSGESAVCAPADADARPRPCERT